MKDRKHSLVHEIVREMAMVLETISGPAAQPRQKTKSQLEKEKDLLLMRYAQGKIGKREYKKQVRGVDAMIKSGGMKK